MGGLWDGSRGAGASVPVPTAAPSRAERTPQPEPAALGRGRLPARLRSHSSWSQPSIGATSRALLVLPWPPPVLLPPVTASSPRAGLIAAVLLREPQRESVCAPKRH